MNAPYRYNRNYTMADVQPCIACKKYLFLFMCWACAWDNECFTNIAHTAGLWLPGSYVKVPGFFSERLPLAVADEDGEGLKQFIIYKAMALMAVAGFIIMAMTVLDAKRPVLPVCVWVCVSVWVCVCSAEANNFHQTCQMKTDKPRPMGRLAPTGTDSDNGLEQYFHCVNVLQPAMAAAHGLFHHQETICNPPTATDTSTLHLGTCTLKLLSRRASYMIFMLYQWDCCCEATKSEGLVDFSYAGWNI